MKISVIGTIIKDYLYPYNGGIIQGFGGIHFTISHLSAIFRDTDLIIPITYVGKDIYNDFIKIIKKLKNVSSEGLFQYNRRNNSVILKYSSNYERMEISKYPLPSISIEKIKPYLDTDFLIINMISGWDIKISTVEKFRNIFSGKIYLDLHSYLLGKKSNGERYYRKPDDFQKWFDLVDYISDGISLEVASISLSLLSVSSCRFLNSGWAALLARRRSGGLRLLVHGRTYLLKSHPQFLGPVLKFVCTSAV